MLSRAGVRPPADPPLLAARHETSPALDCRPRCRRSATESGPSATCTGAPGSIGDRFTLRLAAIGTRVVVTDAASIRDVFGLKPHEFVTDSTMLEPFLGSGSVLCQDGEVHARERRLLAQRLSTGGPRGLRRRDGGHRSARHGVVARRSSSSRCTPAFRRSPSRSSCGSRSASTRPTGSTICATACSPFLRQGGSLLVLNPGFRRELRGHSPWARFQRLRSDVLAALAEEIGQRRNAADLDVRTDVLSLLLRAESDGDHLDDDEVLDNLLTMVLAGHDTTATALAWTFDLLLHHPVAMDRLRADLADGSRDYIGAVIRESMRLRPVVIDTGRTLAQPTPIGDTLYAAPDGDIAEHLARPPPRRRLSRSHGVSPRAVPRPGSARAPHLDPVRGWSPPLPRRRICDARDGDRSPDHSRALRALGRPRPRGHTTAPGRDADSTSRNSRRAGAPAAV